jgi:UDPglucose 6-dehydrogenase
MNICVVGVDNDAVKIADLDQGRMPIQEPGLEERVVFDGRNVWEPERMRRLGFEYHSVGRKPVLPS